MAPAPRPSCFSASLCITIGMMLIMMCVPVDAACSWNNNTGQYSCQSSGLATVPPIGEYQNTVVNWFLHSNVITSIASNAFVNLPALYRL